jgi:hypothetical protein
MSKARDAEEAESQRIIRRVGQETEASMAARATKRARDHLSAADAPEDDWVEVWGTRIGRGLGLVVFVALLAWVAFVVFPAA